MPDNPRHAGTPCFALTDHAIVELTGRDAVAFAQAQLMNDVASLGEGQWQWNGWLTPKGRVIALMAVLRTAMDTVWLVLQDADPAVFTGQLQRFVFRSKVTLKVRDDLRVGGAFAAPAVASGALAAIDERGVVAERLVGVSQRGTRIAATRRQGGESLMHDPHAAHELRVGRVFAQQPRAHQHDELGKNHSLLP